MNKELLLDDKRNYILRPSYDNNYWANVSGGRIDRLIQEFGDQFYIYFCGSDKSSYEIPFSVLKEALTDEFRSADNTGRLRWITTIKNHQLKVGNYPSNIDVAEYYTAGSNAWLVIAAGDDRQFGGNEGYEDKPDVYYSWDDTVPNHAKIQVGDSIVLWDKHALLGASVIERIEKKADVAKNRRRCPSCGHSAFHARRNAEKRFRCKNQDCKSEFSKPEVSQVNVSTYRGYHPTAWIDLDGFLAGAELRSVCEKPKSQQSIRKLDWARFIALLPNESLRPLIQRKNVTQSILNGGHRSQFVRVRIGQGRFRKKLLDKYGAVCAFSGTNPPQVLEAAHLYSYSEEGEHHREGGLLMRRDLHRLFDLGLLAVEPSSSELHFYQSICEYESYSHLDLSLIHI